MSKPIDPAVLVNLIDSLLRFPDSKVCIHYVAVKLLDQLERHGYPVSAELAHAVVNAEDEIALELLPTLGVQYEQGK